MVRLRGEQRRVVHHLPQVTDVHFPLARVLHLRQVPLEPVEHLIGDAHRLRGVHDALHLPCRADDIPGAAREPDAHPDDLRRVEVRGQRNVAKFPKRRLGFPGVARDARQLPPELPVLRGDIDAREHAQRLEDALRLVAEHP
jgi:hypothetical protein